MALLLGGLSGRCRGKGKAAVGCGGFCGRDGNAVRRCGDPAVGGRNAFGRRCMVGGQSCGEVVAGRVERAFSGAGFENGLCGYGVVVLPPWGGVAGDYRGLARVLSVGGFWLAEKRLVTRRLGVGMVIVRYCGRGAAGKEKAAGSSAAVAFVPLRAAWGAGAIVARGLDWRCGGRFTARPG